MMKYDKSGTGWGRGDALFACDARRGNCTDFHALVIGMARSVGIPARFAIGLPLPEARGSGEIPGYHCWAELYVEGRGWVPVDASEAAKNPTKRDYFFGHHDENRLEFSRGRHLTLVPAQQGPPLNFFVYPYAEVDGKPHEAIDRKFTFTRPGATLDPDRRGAADDPQAGRHPDLPRGRSPRLLRTLRGLLRHPPGRGPAAGGAVAVRGAGGRRGAGRHRRLGRAQGDPQPHPGRLPAARHPRRARRLGRPHRDATTTGCWTGSPSGGGRSRR